MSDEPTGTTKQDYVPAAPQLRLYDFLVAALARESRWRPALLRQIDPRRTDAIADIGCGTGTLVALIGQTVQPAVLVGIDPDPAILERARRKVAKAGARVDFKLGYARDAANLLDGYGINK